MDKYSVTIYDGDRKIAAIKALRSVTAPEAVQGQITPANALGIKEAKDIVESGFKGFFMVVMTKKQVFRFLEVTVKDNEAFGMDNAVRITGLAKLSNPNDISNL